MKKPIIEINNLSFSYPNSPKILKSINIKIFEGEFVGIMGPSPSGKSTLAYAIAGLIPHYIEGEMEGDIVVAGLNTKEHTIAELSQYVGIVLQDPDTQLLELRVIDEIALSLENLGLPREEILKRVNEVMKIVNIEKYAEKCPLELSGGEKQRVAIASVLALKPKVIVLDEPTANIDVPGTYKVYETLYKLNKELGLTIVIIENKTDFLLKYADRIVIMRDGKIIADGPTKTILSNKELLLNNGIDPPNEDVKIKNKRNYSEKALIEIKNVHYVYPDGTYALKGINLEIKEGETIFLMGENGSGKSTLAKHLNGLLKPTKGKVIVDGKDTKTTPTYKLAKIVGLVFQNPSYQIVGDTVYDEIAMGLRNLGYSEDFIDKEVKRIAKIFGLSDKLEAVPEELSVGELKRLMVASVVAMKPKVIVLDEPMTGMTRVYSRKVLRCIKEALGEKCTIVAITHDPLLAMEFADRIILMHEGRIIEQGEPTVIAKSITFNNFVKEVICEYV